MPPANGERMKKREASEAPSGCSRAGPVEKERWGKKANTKREEEDVPSLSRLLVDGKKSGAGGSLSVKKRGSKRGPIPDL